MISYFIYKCTIFVELPDAHLGHDRRVHFELCFGEMEIQATARNEYDNKVYRTKFDFKF